MTMNIALQASTRTFSSSMAKPALVAYNTALVLLPPREYAHRINPFRSVHDKSGLRWTAHLTMSFPFVEPQHLTGTVASLREAVKDIQPFKVSLDKVDSFSKSGYDTVHLAIARKEHQQEVQHLGKTLAVALGYRGRPFKPHMTLGQASNRNSREASLLHQKAQLLLSSVRDIEWIVGSVVVLKKDDSDGGIMKFYDEIFLGDHTESAYQATPLFPTLSLTSSGNWSWNETPISTHMDVPSTLTIATYNLPHDMAASDERAGHIIDEIVGVNADILCLQEVSDENLAVILGSSHVRSIYRFSSRDPMVTLENERNLMFLSRFPFDLAMLDTGARRKPACIATFNSGGKTPPLVVGCIHPTTSLAYLPLQQDFQELSSVMETVVGNYPDADWAIISGFGNNDTIATNDLFDCLHPSSDGSPRNYQEVGTPRELNDQSRNQMYLKHSGSWVAGEFASIGVGEEEVSGHRGLKVSLRRANMP